MLGEEAADMSLMTAIRQPLFWVFSQAGPFYISQQLNKRGWWPPGRLRQWLPFSHQANRQNWLQREGATIGCTDKSICGRRPERTVWKDGFPVAVCGLGDWGGVASAFVSISYQ